MWTSCFVWHENAKRAKSQKYKYWYLFIVWDDRLNHIVLCSLYSLYLSTTLMQNISRQFLPQLLVSFHDSARAVTFVELSSVSGKEIPGRTCPWQIPMARLWAAATARSRFPWHRLRKEPSCAMQRMHWVVPESHICYTVSFLQAPFHILWHVQTRISVVIGANTILILIVWFCIYFIGVASSNNVTKVTGRFRTVDKYRKEYSNSSSSEFQAYATLVQIAVCWICFEISFALRQHNYCPIYTCKLSSNVFNLVFEKYVSSFFSFQIMKVYSVGGRYTPFGVRVNSLR